MRPLVSLAALWGLALPPRGAADYCEWHLEYLLYNRVNYTEDPPSFEMSTDCTALHCSTYLWGSLDDKGAAALAGQLQLHPQLEELNVGYNNIGDAGAIALAGALHHLRRLRVLFLGWNSIGDAGAKALAKGLRYLQELQELNVFWNNVGEAGAEALAEALRYTPKLRVLNLAWNSVGNPGAIALSEALKGTPDLEDLSLRWSGVGNAGAIGLAGTLQHLPKLRTLQVRWNPFGESGATALADAVAALEEAHPGLRVSASGIPWPILEAARNASASSSSGGQPGDAKAQSAAAEEDSAAVCRVRSIDALTCSSHRCSALVVGNTNYKEGALPSALRRDAEDVAAALEKLGFEVARLFDGTRKQMNKALKAYFKTVAAGGVSLLYFIGHAFQLDGANHLLPVDFPMDQGVKAVEKAVAVAGLLQSLGKRKAAANVVVLDASRPTPFRAKAALEGLAPMVAPLHTLLALPAAPGAVRWSPPSAPESTSLYTRRLLEHLAEPQLHIEEVFKRLRKQVVNETDGRQVPWDSSALVADVVLVPDGPVVTAASGKAAVAEEEEPALAEQEDL